VGVLAVNRKNLVSSIAVEDIKNHDDPVTYVQSMFFQTILRHRAAASKLGKTCTLMAPPSGVLVPPSCLRQDLQALGILTPAAVGSTAGKKATTRMKPTARASDRACSKANPLWDRTAPGFDAKDNSMKTASRVVRHTVKKTCKNSFAKATQVLRMVAKAAGVSLELPVDQEQELASLRLVHAAQVAGLAARRTSKMTASATTTAGAFLSLSTPPGEDLVSVRLL
jgi:hypothetical protein